MEQVLVEAAKTNSPSVIICALMMVGLYYLIKGQREKTATKRDSDKQHLELQLALQAKDIENLKSQVTMLSGRWDTLQEILGKINENLSAIRENILNLDKRIDRVEHDYRNSQD